MLIVTANWAFTDGSLVAHAGRARAARAWLRGIRSATVRSGFGRDGVYHPPAALAVVLAGDTFDTLASAAWSGRARPWHDGSHAAHVRGRVLHGCAHRAAPFLAGLARLARAGLPVPAADRRGRPSTAAVVRVPVRVAVLAGDRDGHVAEAAAAWGTRDVTVAPAWSDGTVLVRHGHEFDPACQGGAAPRGEDRQPTLAESVAVDLVAAFAGRLAAAGVPRHAAAPIVEALAGSGPADLPATIAAWTSADGPVSGHDAARRDVEAEWRRAVDAWLRAARRDPPDCGLPASPLEALAEWFQGGATVPPPALAPIFDRRLPATIGVAEPGSTVVLGHPASSHGTRAICLGWPPMRRWGPLAVIRAPMAADVACVAAAPATTGPATVVCRRAGDAVEWLWPGVTGTPAVEDGVDTVAVVDAA